MIDFEARLLTDENVHPQVVSFLRGRGCNVLDVKELGQMGTSDPEIVRRAANKGRMIITHDRDVD
ncbi:hypothetical protein BSZ35_16135 [Salinibacter sp. 10B]|uniref:DUF5615 family PIN-like protein n=1 Tax=Salinibacter sp. 10B TaxID=1923971 RepID=UPI000CF3985C|nr:DUF5615 family PIN-like protein [Salinibacter sp. 10B]PQJ35927.1 hypothetical protein BSZ35_16135 [Salinibacter sp. 10B]